MPTALAPFAPTLSTASLGRLGGFAGNVFGENLLYQAGRSLGTLLIGGYLTAAAVGAYALATNVILVPFARLAGPLQQVFFPAFSRMDGDRGRIADVWIRASRLIGAVTIPALVGLVIVAPDFVDVVLGSKWSAATPVIQILAWVGIVQALQTLNGEVLLALGKAGTLLRFTAVWFVGVVSAYAFGIRWGVVGVAACYAIATALLEPLRAYLTTRALGIPLRRFVAAFGGVVQASALMALVVFLLRQALISTGFEPATRLLLLVPVGIAAYVAACFVRAPEVVDEVKRVRRR